MSADKVVKEKKASKKHDSVAARSGSASASNTASSAKSAVAAAVNVKVKKAEKSKSSKKESLKKAESESEAEAVAVAVAAAEVQSDDGEEEMVFKYNEADGSYATMLEHDLQVQVRSFRGIVYVDIRKLWDGKPTKKGISLTGGNFAKLMKGTEKIDELVRKLKK